MGSKFYAEDLHLLGNTLHNLVAMAIWRPGFARPWYNNSQQSHDMEMNIQFQMSVTLQLGKFRPAAVG
jgi:hypothetical protein